MNTKLIFLNIPPGEEGCNTHGPDLLRHVQRFFSLVELTMSSVASLAAVTESTRTRGTTVVNQERDEISGIS